MQPVCCGCLSEITDDTSKEIFKQDVPFQSQRNTVNTEIPERERRLTLCQGIELITGFKVDKANERSARLCDGCCQKVASYLNFRAHLLSSLGALNVLGDPSEDSSVLSWKTVESRSLDAEITLVRHANEKDNQRDVSKPLSEEIVNVDENSTPLNFDPNFSLNEEADSYDFTANAKLQNDQTNNNLNETDSSNDGSGVSLSDEHLLKIQENDLESEIDVCSGEDNEVLELDSRSRRDETVEISSSSDSDIEVCDYEPTGKRIKCYRALSPPLLY